MDLSNIGQMDLTITPAAMPPPGIMPNLKDPESRGHILTGISSALLFVMWAFVLARCWIKAKVNKKFTLDDYTCLLAAIFVSGYYVITVYAVTHCGIGTHQWDITLSKLFAQECLIDLYFSTILAAPTLLIIKVSFFIFYTHLFRPIAWLRTVNYVGAAITIIGYTGFFIALMVLATPRTTWLEQYVSDRQTKAGELAIPLPAFGLALDILILAVPLLGISNLQLPLRRKIGVGFIFLTGILAIIASILAITFRLDMQHDLRNDVTWTLMSAYLTSNVEMTLGVCILCMPSFSHMIRHSLPMFESLRSVISMRLLSRRSKTTDFENLSGRSSGEGRSGFQSQEKNGTFGTQRSKGISQPFNTYVGTGNSPARKGNGVHLKHDIHQEVSPSSEYLRETV